MPWCCSWAWCPQAQQEVTLSVLWFNDANESDVFLETVADYLAANPHAPHLH